MQIVIGICVAGTFSMIEKEWGEGVQHKGDAKKVVFVFFFFCHKCFELGMDHEGWLDFLIYCKCFFAIRYFQW